MRKKNVLAPERLRRVGFEMPEEERLRLMDYLLRIQQQAGIAFDAIERKSISLAELETFTKQLPAHFNTAMDIMQAHMKI